MTVPGGRRAGVLASLAAITVLAAGCADAGSAGGEEPLTGVLAVTPGACDEAGVTEGSYFRMVQPGGDPEKGPFVANADSPCGDTTYTPLAPGSDGGLRLGEHQPHPEEPFDADGNGVADQLLRPQTFFAVDFAVATNPVDPQTGVQTRAPELFHEGQGELVGDLRAVGVAWNGQHFNQGAPKPSGEEPGLSERPQGSFDAETGAITLTWRSEIEGGPFDGFTGHWRLEGILE